MNQGKWSPEEIKILRDNYYDKGPYGCLELLERDILSIKNKARNSKLKQDRERVRRSLERPTLDAMRYINVTEPAVAYILGLLWADGCVSYQGVFKTMRIVKHSCRIDDAESFTPIFEMLGGWQKITTVNRHAISQTPIVANTCSNRTLGEYMVTLNWREKGASPEKVLDTIPVELHHHFYRGYFDGDGCITSQLAKGKYRGYSIYFSSCGNQDWKFMHDLCATFGIAGKTRTLTDKLGVSSQFRFGSNSHVEAFCRYLYQGHEGICLNRKLEKVQALYEYQLVYADSKYKHTKPFRLPFAA